ncbi:MAG: hypothetical protein Q9218_007012 [Villophora microphyllina]
MYSSLMSYIEAAGFWNPKIPTNFKATATNIASQWIHQPAVLAAISSTADSTSSNAVQASHPTYPQAPSTTVSQPPSPTGSISPMQSVSPTPTSTKSLSRFKRLSITAQIFTILGPFIGATIAVLLFILARRHQQRKKERAAGQRRWHGMPNSEAADSEQDGTTNAMNHGNGNAVAGHHNSTRPRNHHHNKYYGPVYLSSRSQPDDIGGGTHLPDYPTRNMAGQNDLGSGTRSSSSAASRFDLGPGQPFSHYGSV